MIYAPIIGKKSLTVYKLNSVNAFAFSFISAWTNSFQDRNLSFFPASHLACMQALVSDLPTEDHAKLRSDVIYVITTC